MKYEMIFGDPLLFDGAPDDIVAVRLNNYKRISHGYLTKEKLGALSVMDLNAIPIVAMRRIIKEPKRWTWEDKKAGRLPEVGSIFTYRDETLTCHFIDGDGEIWAHDIDNKIVTPLLRDCKPIETPAEKAQREEDEFVVAMLDAASQEQLMSAGFKSGVIAAYRKLKGGE